MRVIKLLTAVVMVLALAASAAFAGGACCAAHSASACTAKATAACGSAMANCRVEATRLPSGDLVVHYIGADAEAVKFLHAKAEGSPDKFCCAMTQKMASNEKCHVDMAKVSNGVVVYVTSATKEVVDQYEKDFASLTTTATTTTK